MYLSSNINDEGESSIASKSSESEARQGIFSGEQDVTGKEAEQPGGGANSADPVAFAIS